MYVCAHVLAVLHSERKFFGIDFFANEEVMMPKDINNVFGKPEAE